MINIYDKKYDDYANEHYLEVEKQINKSRNYNLADYEAWFTSINPNKNYSLKKVITATPQELEQIKNDCQLPPNQQYPSYIEYLKYMYNNYFSQMNNHIGDQYNAVVMTNKLGIRVCPLCNRNHINNVLIKQRGYKRTCQLDHFHNKSKYPFLAMSFFNLVPVCPSCNHTKSTDDLDASPYDDNVDFDQLIRFRYKVKSSKIVASEDDIEVTINPGIKTKINNVDVLGLNNAYAIHNDTAYEIMNTHRVYSTFMQEDLHKTFPHLFSSKADVKSKLFGSYLDKSNLKKQVLSKLKKDIFEQLETSPVVIHKP